MQTLGRGRKRKVYPCEFKEISLKVPEEVRKQFKSKAVDLELHIYKLATLAFMQVLQTGVPDTIFQEYQTRFEVQP